MQRWIPSVVSGLQAGGGHGYFTSNHNTIDCAVLAEVTVKAKRGGGADILHSLLCTRYMFVETEHVVAF